MHPNASERVRTHPNQSEHVQKHPKTSKISEKLRETSRKLRERGSNFPDTALTTTLGENLNPKNIQLVAGVLFFGGIDPGSG